MSISVVMCAYNAERYIAASLESIKQQSETGFDLIVVDDGSTDRTLEIIKTQLSGWPRSTVLPTENKGIVAAANAGISQARGDFIFRMDADDVAYPDRFRQQMKYLRRNPECVALGTGVLLVDPELAPIMAMPRELDHAGIDAQHMNGAGGAICNPTAAILRDAFVQVGGYQAEFEWAEDFDLFLRLAEVGKLANLPEVQLAYRQHAASVGHARRAIQASRTNLAIAAAHERRGTAAGPLNISGDANSSEAEIHRKWVWWSILGGHPRTARKHALAALKLEPFHTGNARLLLSAMRGH